MKDKAKPFGVEFLEDAPDIGWGMDNQPNLPSASGTLKKVHYTTGTLNPSDTRTDWGWAGDDVVQ